MSNDQNISGMLKSLKNAFSEDQDNEIEAVEEKKDGVALSDEALKQQLRDKYFGDSTHSENREEQEDPYAIDDDFLKEAVVEEEIPEIKEEIVEDFEEIEEEIEETSEENGTSEEEIYNDEPEEDETSYEDSEDILEVDPQEESDGVFYMDTREATEEDLNDEEITIEAEVYAEEDAEAAEESFEISDEESYEEKVEESLFEDGEDEEDHGFRAENTDTDALLSTMLMTETATNEDTSIEEVWEEPSENIIELVEEDEIICDEPDVVNEEIEVLDSTENDYEDESIDEALGSLKEEYDNNADPIEEIETDADGDTDGELIFDDTEELIEKNETSVEEDTYNDEELEDIYSYGDMTEEEENVNEEPRERLDKSLFAGADYSLTTEQETEDGSEEESDAPLDAEALDDSVFDLMMQMGCYREFKASMKKVEEFETRKENEAEVKNIEAHTRSRSRKEIKSIEDGYRAERRSALIRSLCVGFITSILLIYEFLPLFGVEFVGLFDYKNYPVPYILIGLQFTVINAIILRKRLWRGLRAMFSSAQTVDSLAALGVSVVCLYDILILFGTSYGIPITFNFVVSLLLLWMCVKEHLSLTMSIRSCELMLTDSPKYTLNKSGSVGSVAEKMYRGGYDPEKNIFTMTEIVDVSKYTEKRDDEKISLTARIMVVPSFVCAAVASLVSVMLDSDVTVAASIFMITLLLLLSVGEITVNGIIQLYAQNKLLKKGSLVNFDSAISTCADCDSVVFSDLHLFRKCDPANMGIVFYKSGQESLVLKCLDSVYSTVGGPMADIFSDVTDEDKTSDVRINRIAKNGIDAFVDKRYSVLIGSSAFLERYGIRFPESKDTSQRAGVSVLCVAIGGLPAAKISVKYEIEPMFEVLAERLYENGIRTVVETFDPVVNSAFVTSCRKVGDAPISVVHKNSADFSGALKEIADNVNRGVVSCYSRLKLVEVMVWCRKLKKIKKTLSILSVVFGTLGAALAALALFLGFSSSITQFHVLGYVALTIAVMTLSALFTVPEKDHFTVEALREEWEDE